MSDELTSYVTDRISKLEKFEMKPVRVEITFSAEKSSSRVDVHARGEDIEMHAHCEAEDYFTAVDIALEKMARQLARKKAKVQKHKSPRYRAEAHPETLISGAENLDLDQDFSEVEEVPAPRHGKPPRRKAPKVS